MCRYGPCIRKDLWRFAFLHCACQWLFMVACGFRVDTATQVHSTTFKLNYLICYIPNYSYCLMAPPHSSIRGLREPLTTPGHQSHIITTNTLPPHLLKVDYFELFSSIRSLDFSRAFSAFKESFSSFNFDASLSSPNMFVALASSGPSLCSERIL